MPKYISTPMSQDAMSRLDYDECVDGDLIELILDEQEYKKLWDSHIFEKINSTISTEIADYEDCSIVDLSDLEKIKNIIEAQIKSSNDEKKLLEQFLHIIKQAIINKTGVFFFF